MGPTGQSTGIAARESLPLASLLVAVGALGIGALAGCGGGPHGGTCSQAPTPPECGATTGCADIDGTWSMTLTELSRTGAGSGWSGDWTVTMSTRGSDLAVDDGERTYAGTIDRTTCATTLFWWSDTTQLPGPLAVLVFTRRELRLTFTGTSFTGSATDFQSSTSSHVPGSRSDFTVTGQKICETPCVAQSQIDTKNRSRPVSRVLSRRGSLRDGGEHSSRTRVAARL